MNRRGFIALLGGAAAWPVMARAQHAAMPVVGFLHSGSADAFPHFVAAFRQGLNETGYTEGANVAIEYRWAQGRYDRLPSLVADLVARRVDVIVSGGGTPIAAQAATATIPIVATLGGDPVKAGIVSSLNRPGGNITGVGLFSYSLGPKRLEVLRELVPNAKIIAVLINPTNPDAQTETDRQEVESAAHAAGRQLLVLSANSETEIDTAFVRLVQDGAGALLVMADPVFTNRRDQIIALSAQHKIPAIYDQRDIVAAGGLMSYGSSLRDAYRQLGIYTGKVLKGEKPADLPVQQVVKIELVLNLMTAKSLGLTFPITLLGRADEVIE
jgi:putative tryptophan/tyrosine transport system substrate-binding protein